MVGSYDSFDKFYDFGGLFFVSASWDLSYDPAIVTRGNAEPASALTGAGESEPHWMASLHSLTEDNGPSASSLGSSTNHRLPFVQQFHNSSSSSSSSNNSKPWSSSSMAAAPPPGFHHRAGNAGLPFHQPEQNTPQQLTTAADTPAHRHTHAV